jgi:hypothetical protein
MLYSTFLGDDFTDRVYGLALDTAGDAVVAGASDSARFPTTPSGFRAFCPGANFGGFVSKFSGDGRTLAWSTRLCGSAGDEALAVSVDGQNNVLVGGVTGSADFPATLGAFQQEPGGGQWDGFVAKLSSDGSSLMFGTFLGGGGPDAVHGVSVDGAGNAYAVGRTLSEDFPATGGVPAPLPPSLVGVYLGISPHTTPAPDLRRLRRLGPRGRPPMGWAVAGEVSRPTMGPISPKKASQPAISPSFLPFLKTSLCSDQPATEMLNSRLPFSAALAVKPRPAVAAREVCRNWRRECVGIMRAPPRLRMNGAE